MMRELRMSSSSESARASISSSSDTVEFGRPAWYCWRTFVITFSDRQSEMRVLKISAYVLP